MLNAQSSPTLEPAEEDSVVRELLERRHYLAELRKSGKLEQSN